MSYEQNIIGASNAPAAKPRAAHLSQVNSSLVNSIGEVHELGGRLHKLADRILGSRPEGIGKSGEPQAPESSALQSFARNQESMNQAVSYLREAVNRLEEL